MITKIIVTIGIIIMILIALGLSLYVISKACSFEERTVNILYVISCASLVLAIIGLIGLFIVCAKITRQVLEPEKYDIETIASKYEVTEYDSDKIYIEYLTLGSIEEYRYYRPKVIVDKFEEYRIDKTEEEVS